MGFAGAIQKEYKPASENLLQMLDEEIAVSATCISARA